MVKLPLKIRLLAGFLITFVCLNAGGALCLAYCQSFDSAANTSEHHSLEIAVHHCDKKLQADVDPEAANISSAELDCCPMTVSFFAAPVTKHFISFTEAADQPAIRPAHIIRPAFQAATSFPVLLSYRGPPPLDERGLRIKHRILRI